MAAIPWSATGTMGAGTSGAAAASPDALDHPIWGGSGGGQPCLPGVSTRRAARGASRPRQPRTARGEGPHGGSDAGPEQKTRSRGRRRASACPAGGPGHDRRADGEERRAGGTGWRPGRRGVGCPAGQRGRAWTAPRIEQSGLMIRDDLAPRIHEALVATARRGRPCAASGAVALAKGGGGNGHAGGGRRGGHRRAPAPEAGRDRRARPGSAPPRAPARGPYRTASRTPGLDGARADVSGPPTTA